MCYAYHKSKEDYYLCSSFQKDQDKKKKEGKKQMEYQLEENLRKYFICFVSVNWEN